jgi:hypothetical protein
MSKVGENDDGTPFEVPTMSEILKRYADERYSSNSISKSKHNVIIVVVYSTYCLSVVEQFFFFLVLGDYGSGRYYTRIVGFIIIAHTSTSNRFALHYE